MGLPHLDNLMVEFIVDKNIILAECWREKEKKIALVGETSTKKGKETLAYKLTKRFELNPDDITIFTGDNPFTPDHAKDFDLIIGVRPCKGTTAILDGAHLYGTEFVVMPCTCDDYNKKVPILIRTYTNITHVEALSPRTSADVNAPRSYRAWLFLYGYGDKD